jgi:hypothetical protein
MATTSDVRIQKLREDTQIAISSLDPAFQALVQSSTVDAEDQLATSGRKLQLDVHTMRID